MSRNCKQVVRVLSERLSEVTKQREDKEKLLRQVSNDFVRLKGIETEYMCAIRQLRRE